MDWVDDLGGQGGEIQPGNKETIERGAPMAYGQEKKPRI